MKKSHKKDDKPSKKCKTVGFVAECVECGQAFMASAHVDPKCGGGFQDHSKHHADDCCGYGDHQERRTGLICPDCIFQRNIETLS